MLRYLFGTFILLHGWVHIWYIVLARRWVEYRPEMGWDGQSWLLSGALGDAALRGLAAVVYALAALAFTVAAIGVFTAAGWWRTVVLTAAALSTLAILVFWDGGSSSIVQKGLVGVLINLGLIVGVLLSR